MTASPAKLREKWRNAGPNDRRLLLIDTAMALLKDEGVRGVTMRRLADRVGIGTMTLYTYVSGQSELLREVCRRGFGMLQQACNEHSTLPVDGSWTGGARAYVRFALEHPKLYELMFSTPMTEGGIDLQILFGGFEHHLNKVRQWLADRGLSGAELDNEARVVAGRMWMALHGLASLAIAGRLEVLGGDLDALIEDLLEHTAPK